MSAQPFGVTVSGTGDRHPIVNHSTKPAKNPPAVALGRLGGLKGGAAWAAKLGPKKRSQIAAKAAKARWSKKP